MQQDVEVRRQERVEIDEGGLVEIGAIGAGIFQLGVVPQRLAMLIEQCPERRCPFGRLAEQTGKADFLDVVRVQIDLDREAILELE